MSTAARKNDTESKAIINISTVPMRSLFRYPGGKTWLVPTIREWLGKASVSHLVEPFAGGGIVSLSALAEGRVSKATLIERDPDVAAAWLTILDEPGWLIERIRDFRMTPENINAVLSRKPLTQAERGFQTLLRNRTNYGGILRQGAGRLKAGENGKGLSSRWYPETMVRRIEDIMRYRDRIAFYEGDAFDFLTEAWDQRDTYFFIDPPYTKQGKKLYTYSDIDHEALIQRIASLEGHYLVTYDKSDYIEKLAERYHLPSRVIPMRTNHHVQKEEILLSDDFGWLDQRG